MNLLSQYISIFSNDIVVTKIYIGSHSREHKHDSKVDGDDGLEEKGLEVDGDVAHDVEEHGG